MWLIMQIFNDLYKYREFLKTSIKKEFRGKYKKYFLGVLWSFLNPLFQLLVYALVFPFILKNNVDNYIIFLIVALMPWNFFNMTILQSAASIVSNGGIIKKVYFPREILPISTATSNLLNFLITGIIVFAALIISGIGIGTSILVLPLIVLIQYILQLGLSFIFSSITVYVRDVEYLLNVFMMLMFYLCPIVYSADMIPKKFLPLFKINPMFHIIGYYRTILYDKQIPNISHVLLLLLVCLLILFIGYLIFQKCKKRFAEEL